MGVFCYHHISHIFVSLHFEQNNELKMNLETTIGTVVAQAVETLYGLKIEANQIQLQKTKREFEGDLTVVIFPFVKGRRADLVFLA